MANIKDILVPDIGDFDAVEVIEVLIKTGDQIAVEDPLISIESDKATMEIPSSDTGIIKKVHISVGDKISKGSTIASIESTDTANSPQAKPPKQTEQQPAPKPTATNKQQLDIIIPDIGDFNNIPIIDILVSAGDNIAIEQALITLESDKATLDIPAPQAGIINHISVKIGDTVSAGHIIGNMTTYDTNTTQTTTQATPTNQPTIAQPPVEKPAPQTTTNPNSVNHDNFIHAHASPSVRKLARELGIDLSLIHGTGRNKRITDDDLKTFVKHALTSRNNNSGINISSPPQVDFSQFGETEIAPLTHIQQLTGKNLHASWITIPHVTQFEQTDTTNLESFRKTLNAELKDKGEKITPLAFIVKAVVSALKQFPRFNSSLDSSQQNLILKKYINIGIAVDTPAGLTVPVIKNAEHKSIRELAADIIDLSARAREKKLSPADMQGGCFTISSLGGIGGTAFTPIINPPEVAILGLSKSQMQPVWDGEQFVPRLMLPMALSYDHRVIDGVAGAKFTCYLATVLNDTRRLL